MSTIDPAAVDAALAQITADAEASAYHINPDTPFTRDLIEGLLVNEARYGYRACPCRLADGDRARDLDLICPCDYRDPDLEEFGACYCALYVSAEIARGERDAEPIPDRRPADPPAPAEEPAVSTSELPYPVWRCKVCGYLCARNNPPAQCPICKVTKERFERFM
ncbi:MAG: ferredoxin-thioredoxin reductase catalytic domain-containing protein [Armatimonadota bacterium]